MSRARPFAVLPLAAALVAGCVATEEPFDPGPNPFLEDGSGGDGKEDTGYVNLRGLEVEVTIEADLEAPAYRMFDGPAELAQYAVTFLRSRRDVYLEILAEDADVPSRVQWLVDGEWLTYEQARAAGAERLRRFRIPDVNVVLMGQQAERVTAGQVLSATVPVRPYATMQEGGQACATPDGHISLSQDVYWYLWNPTRSGCSVATQEMTLTVEELLPRNPESYPEYDRLVEDGRLDVVVLWAKLDDGDVADDYNWRNVDSLVRFLTEAGFAEEQNPPLGRRFVRVRGELTETIDVYGPDLFHSVADYARLQNWQTAVSTHEVVMYNGHSVLGSGMAFEQVQYPDFYQIFSVGSCLSYEYYVRPVLEGKGGWENVDVVSNVDPTYYSENFPLVTTLLARLLEGAENGGQTSWQDIMEAVSRRLGHARFGVSGARGNCFSPEGDRCEEPPPPPPDQARYESTEPAAVPDNDPRGATSVLEVEDGPTIGTIALELDVTHTYVGDLTVTLEHGGTTETVWSRTGGSADDIRATFDLPSFAGASATGTWTLRVVDSARIDTGTLNRWALVVTPAS